jgi:hypothetical protein
MKNTPRTLGVNWISGMSFFVIGGEKALKLQILRFILKHASRPLGSQKQTGSYHPMPKT